MSDLFRLSLLPTELQKLTGEPSPGYRSLYGKILDGQLPAKQINGRWQVDRANLPIIAEKLGLRRED
jgi:hypothetical protein